ncbi:RNA polymerase I-specific transcription-initiation factor-domain-containing protein [Morchella snyderi]|nr:RNA polymerase I-specific transcription-initiation factor-domain-containing protein [Morchella snyderi]
MLTIDTNRPPVYSHTLRKWLHQYREPAADQDHTLHAITPPTTVLPRTYYPTDSSRPGIRYLDRDWWYRCLAQDAPETGAAVGHIDALLAESQIVTTHAEILDPTIGTLLAFGGALDEQRNGRFTETAVMAMGAVGSEIGLGSVVEGWRGVEGAKGVSVGVLGISGVEKVVECGGRVRQVCTAGGESKSSMAVRTASSTMLFRQRRLAAPLPGQATRLAAIPLASVAGGAGKRAHAHVTFNPWYEKQFGIIDEGGRWRVYDLEGAQARDWRIRSNIKALETAKGYVGAEGGTGWGRLLWGADVNSVIACDRKRAGLFDIRNAPSTRADITIPVYQGVDQGYLLDLQRGPESASQTNDVFLLTSATLTWLDLRYSAKPIMSLPHYRHQNDFSLAMSLLHIDRTTINVLLYSRLNHLINSFRFDHNTAENFPITLGRPTTVSGLAPRDASAPVQLGLTVHQCPLKQHGHTDQKGEEYLSDEHLRFFTAFSTGPDLEITQRVYSNKDLSITLHPDRGREVKSAYAIPPVAESDSDNEGVPPTLPPAEQRVGFRALYKHAFPRTDPTLRTASEDDSEHSIAAATAHLKAALTRRLTRGDLGIITLLNLHRPGMLYDSLDAFQTSVHTLLTTDPDLALYQLRTLLPSSAAAATATSNNLLAITTDTTSLPSINIEQTYTHILHSWVTPLPEHTPPRVRLRRERLSRALATDLFLSTLGVNLQPQPQPEPPGPEHLLGIRTYANVSAPRVTLPDNLAGVLGRWVVGEDPQEVEYVPDEEDEAARARRRRRKQLRKAREGGDDVGRLRGEVESWSLGMGSQLLQQPPAVVAVAATQGGSQGVGLPASSQVGPGLGVMSQVERGRHGGRAPVGRKKRRTGF